MYSVTVEKTFAASHSLREYEGVCHNLHGHNFKVLVELMGESIDHRGMLIDFIEIDNILDNILKELDHKNLNMVSPFTKINPTAENIAKYIYEKVKKSISDHTCTVSKVIIYETDEFYSSYFEK